MRQLTVVTGPDQGTVIPLESFPVRIGRDARNDVVLRDALISRFQAQLELGANGGLRIVDQGSTNGTEVNGVRTTTAELVPGDTLQMGGTMLLVSDLGDPGRPVTEHPMRRTLHGSPELRGLPEGYLRFDPAELLRSHRSLNALYRADGIEASGRAAEAVCRDFLRLAVETLATAQGSIHLLEREAREKGGGEGGDGDEPRLAAAFPDGTRPRVSQTVLDLVLRSDQALLVRDALEDARVSASESVIVSRIRSVLAVPLRGRDRVLGVMQIVSTDPERKFEEDDLRLLTALSAKLSAALETARLYRELNELFLSTTWTLVEALEAKDPYTRGHSERVARYALLLGREIGIETPLRRDLYYAAVFHDIGKIGMPDRILHSTDKLTDEEFARMKEHPVVGARLLEKIPGLEGAVPGIRHHHENFDGTGYPDRLAGEAIPLFARIVAIADAFDAITTDRPYRPGRPPGEAVAVIRADAGKRFDPAIARRFVEAVERRAGVPLSRVEG